MGSRFNSSATLVAEANSALSAICFKTLRYIGMRLMAANESFFSEWGSKWLLPVGYLYIDVVISNTARSSPCQGVRYKYI
jgi:hypothetical protein